MLFKSSTDAVVCNLLNDNNDSNAKEIFYFLTLKMIKKYRDFDREIGSDKSN